MISTFRIQGILQRRNRMECDKYKFYIADAWVSQSCRIRQIADYLPCGHRAVLFPSGAFRGGQSEDPVRWDGLCGGGPLFNQRRRCGQPPHCIKLVEPPAASPH